MRPALLHAQGLSQCAPPEGGKIACLGSAPYPVLAFEHDWKKALRDGVIARSASEPLELVVHPKSIAAALAAAAPAPPTISPEVEVVFAVDPKMIDGRHANNTWLLELGDPVTKVAWCNAALVSPATARAFGVESGDMIRLSSGDRSVTIAALILPGTADGSIGLTLGWGRTRAGRIGNGQGFDVQPLRTTDAMTYARGVRLEKVPGRYEFARTQEHDSMEGRPLAREAKRAEYQAQPHFAELQDPPRRSLPLWSDVDYSKGHQWGMSIDLNACTGCSACVIACQAENNIPVVGKDQVAMGRGMEWIRIDRYFKGGEDPLVVLQPLTCVQCEEAPCENVCPVAALEHSAEGLSEITYNRCIGTRYCANNCPYKVRRFNYLNWHNDGVWKSSGGLPETLQMQQNPNVTVRFRGVVEKCTYCVQRIQEQRFVAKREGRDLRDGDVVTACQQTCPADAIVFGDLNDMTSRVSKLTISDRRYTLLEELGTKPRTTYLAKVRNPNPEMT
jgi:molybdopterin-containing oxidoreductase family iron-sulfur binding subunit